MKPAILLVVAVAMIAVGVAGGLYFTWILAPIETYETSPDSLHVEDKFHYLAIIGDLYVCEKDLTQAQSRLVALEVEPDGPALADLIEQYLDRGGRPDDVRNLAQMARDLGASGGILLVFGTQPSPSPEATPSPLVPQPVTSEPGVSPTPTLTATPVPAFQLVEKTALCGEATQDGRILVWVHDQGGQEMAGVEVVASWATGQDRFFTGLRPEIGSGYADFTMNSDVEYSISLASFEGDVAEGLTADLVPGICPTETLALDWRLVFQQRQ